MAKVINVVAAVIKNSEGKVLIAQRCLKKAQGGLWEFPGGKIEPNETREHAIVREIKEELFIDISADKYLSEKEFVYPEKTINLIALACTHLSGEIKPTEHEDIKWVTKEELNNYEFAPADYFIVNNLKENM